MGTQMIVRLDERTKNRFFKLARMEGRTASEKIREMVEEYIRENDVGLIIDDLWKRVGDKIKRKGFGERDIEKIVREVRTKE